MRKILLAGVSLAALGVFSEPVLADNAAVMKQLEQMQLRLDAQEKSIAEQKSEIAKLKAQLTDGSVAPAKAPAANVQELSAKVDAQEQQIDALQTQAKQSTIKAAEEPSFSLSNGRPSFTTASGNFSAALRALVQFDGGYYMQSTGATSDLSSGSNFRRARIGLSGRLYNVWDYYFLYDFGGSGVEGSSISSAYIQYNGLGPVTIRAGAFPPAASLEDSEGAADTLFLEKSSAVEITRAIAGADSRSAIAAIVTQPRYFASLAYTGSKVGASGVFDEQQAMLGRFAYSPWSNDESTAVVGVNGSYVFKTADAAPGPGSASSGVNFQNSPELRVDDTSANGTAQSLVSTGNINASSVTQWGVDGAANWKSFYGEGGYFNFGADRRGGSNPDFDGWYAQASWVVTGERRRYDTSSAAFKAPKVSSPVNGDLGGYGALELAARYSIVDLDYHAGIGGAATPDGGIRGGEQDIWTVGVNWYLNDELRLMFDYQHDDIDRLSPAGLQIGQRLDALSFRIEVSL
jgi:phosphate-selective porin OprO and OprP